MADKKISALTSAATPLAGTEVLPIVQSGSTVKVAVSDITAGRAVAFSSFTSTGGNIMADSTLLTWGNQGQGIQGVNTGGILRFYGSYAEQARLSSAGFFVTNGDVQIGTAGRGIDFSANTHAPGMTSELLNWYEEGTFTPVWSGGSVTVGLSKYTRIGRNVVWIFDITFGASASPAASTLTLPFPCADAWGAGSINGTDIGSSLYVNVDGGSNTLGFRATADGGNLSAAAVSTKRVIGMAVYNA